MSSPVVLPRTLTAALAEQRNPPEAYAQYSPYLSMTKRFIGEEPSFYPILSLSPTAIRTHVGLFARMFHAPLVDMRAPGMPSPALRRAAFIASSRAFHCSYCTAHAYSFGDMFRGSVPSQMRRDTAPGRDEPLPGAEVVEALATAAVQRPSSAAAREALQPLMQEVAVAVGPRALEVVKAVIAFSGALNTVMDVMGVELEAECQRFAASQLKTETGENWQPGEYHFNPSEEASREFDAEDTSAGALSNFKGLMGTMPAAVTSMKFEVFTLYREIPIRAGPLKAWLTERIGEEGAEFFNNIVGAELRRAFCFGLQENLAIYGTEAAENSPKRKWTLEQRLRFLHLFGTVTGSEGLCRDAIHAAAKSSGRDIADHRSELEEWSSRDAGDSIAEAAENAARKLIVANATAMDNITAELIAELTEKCDPEACLELASLLSFFEMWRRMELLFGTVTGCGRLPVIFEDTDRLSSAD